MVINNLYELNQVRQAYSGRVVLDVPSLEIPGHSITALVGPNGAGKSTLLRLLALLEAPLEGNLCFAGEPVDLGNGKVLALRRQVTLVGHSPLVFKSTVYSNMAFGLKVRGIPRSEWPGRINEALEFVDLADRKEREGLSLSAGEMQRLALARAIVFRPKALLLDEPTANVDASRVSRIEALISELNLRFGTTVVFSTHNLSQAFGLTDRVIHLAAGKLVDRAHENIFSGQIQGPATDPWIEFRGGKIHLAAGHSGHVSCMVSPRDIKLIGLPFNDDRPNCFSGQVTRLELRGGMARLRVDAGAQFRIDADPGSLAGLGVTLGSRVGIAFDYDAIKILD